MPFGKCCGVEKVAHLTVVFDERKGVTHGTYVRDERRQAFTLMSGTLATFTVSPTVT